MESAIVRLQEAPNACPIEAFTRTPSQSSAGNKNVQSHSLLVEYKIGYLLLPSWTSELFSRITNCYFILLTHYGITLAVQSTILPKPFKIFDRRWGGIKDHRARWSLGIICAVTFDCWAKHRVYLLKEKESDKASRLARVLAAVQIYQVIILIHG